MQNDTIKNILSEFVNKETSRLEVIRDTNKGSSFSRRAEGSLRGYRLIADKLDRIKILLADDVEKLYNEIENRTGDIIPYDDDDNLLIGESNAYENFLNKLYAYLK